jgi:alpha-D-ribose 1-methylphosphonate 5-triphosphate synthase subunit PhnI
VFCDDGETKLSRLTCASCRKHLPIAIERALNENSFQKRQITIKKRKETLQRTKKSVNKDKK